MSGTERQRRYRLARGLIGIQVSSATAAQLRSARAMTGLSNDAVLAHALAGYLAELRRNETSNPGTVATSPAASGPEAGLVPGSPQPRRRTSPFKSGTSPLSDGTARQVPGSATSQPPEQKQGVPPKRESTNPVSQGRLALD